MRLMQDGVPYHSARTTLVLASKQNACSAVPRLFRSPDQNPIEHICDVVKRSGDRDPRNVRELQRFIVEEGIELHNACLRYVAPMRSHW